VQHPQSGGWFQEDIWRVGGHCWFEDTMGSRPWLYTLAVPQSGKKAPSRPAHWSKHRIMHFTLHAIDGAPKGHWT
jgi:hypothetical protein